ncbi:MAG: hypothetical protein AAFQ09_13340, partial [Pseudomonadota bacterium]
ERVLLHLRTWQGAGKQNTKELEWMCKHALRGLIKAGDPAAMRHLGYQPDAPVRLSHFGITPDVIKRGDSAEIALELIVDQPTPMILDYVIDFVKANGKTAPKVFKLKVLEAKADKPIVLKKKHIFKDNATTFTLYPGRHELHAQVNGRIVATVAFDLT